MEELIQGEGDVFSEFLTPEKAAISTEGLEALTLHHFRPFLLSQGGDREQGKVVRSGIMARGKELNSARE